MIIDVPLHIEESIIKYTTENKIDLNNLVSEFLIEYLEDLEDIKAIEEAIKNDDGVYYTFDEMLEHLGIDNNEI